MQIMPETAEPSRYYFILEDEYEWDCDLHSGEGIEEEEDD